MIKVCHEINPNGLVKFQLFNPDDDKGKPHYDWVKDHALTFDQAKELFDYGASIGQEVFFSVFHLKYIDWCKRIRTKTIKLARNESREERYYKVIGKFTQIIASTEYRVPPSNIDGYIIKWLYCPKGKLDPFYSIKFDGLSDHTTGIGAAKITLARGAQIIEKHFVLKHNPEFPDNDWSMTPEELTELVRWEKVCQEVLG